MPKETKWTPEYVEYVQRIIAMMDPVSLDKNINPDKDGEYTALGEVIEDRTQPSVDEVIIEQERKDIVHEYVSKYLNEREQKIIRLRFGFDDGNPMSLEQIGKRFNLSRERVRQIEARAIRKLRQRFVRNKIKEENL